MLVSKKAWPAVLLTPDGLSKTLTVDLSEFKNIYPLLDCDMIQVLQSFDKRHVLYVDENGLLKRNPRFNKLATRHYAGFDAVEEEERSIVGRALLVTLADYREAVAVADARDVS